MHIKRTIDGHYGLVYITLVYDGIRFSDANRTENRFLRHKQSLFSECTPLINGQCIVCHTPNRLRLK